MSDSGSSRCADAILWIGIGDVCRQCRRCTVQRRPVPLITESTYFFALALGREILRSEGTLKKLSPGQFLWGSVFLDAFTVSPCQVFNVESVCFIDRKPNIFNIISITIIIIIIIIIILIIHTIIIIIVIIGIIVLLLLSLLLLLLIQ